MRSIVKGKAGPNLLVGDPQGTTFYYNVDGVFAAGTHGTLVGDPGHPGLNANYHTDGAGFSSSGNGCSLPSMM